MTRILLAVLAFGLIAGLTGCQADDDTGDVGGGHASHYGDPGGIVLTPRGGIGLNLGGGLYIDPATGGVGIGIPLS